VSASQLLRSGRLVHPEPIAEWLSNTNRLALASPLGWAPAADASGSVPTYPLGLPFVMALFTVVGGANAVFFVAPVLALATLLVVHRFARDTFDRDSALMAVALVACNPVFVAYAKQPMSDVPATLWVSLATLMSLGTSRSSSVLAGLAAGAAVITRPALVIASAMIAVRRPIALAVLAVMVAIQLLLNWMLFGSPFSTGYGESGVLFSASHVSTNAGIFARHTWVTLGPILLGGLIIGMTITRRDVLWRVLSISAAVMIPYLFYLPFDHWETLRYLLPATVLWLVIAAAGLMWIAKQPRNPHVGRAVAVALVAAIALRSEALLRQSSVWDIQSVEARYPLAGQWLNVNTPPQSVALANQHSGSLRWYGNRPTLRWDLLAPAALAPTVRELEAKGATVYVALEGDEVAMFDSRFADVIDELRVDHVGRVRNVQFRRLMKKEPASFLRKP
jgi:hypothetical protein